LPAAQRIAEVAPVLVGSQAQFVVGGAEKARDVATAGYRQVKRPVGIQVEDKGLLSALKVPGVGQSSDLPVSGMGLGGAHHAAGDQDQGQQAYAFP
jgi:hypothetical protein